MDNCTEIVKHPTIVLCENKRKMIFLNPNRNQVKKIIVDGCAIIEGKKCDFLVHDKDEYEFFIELKGKNIKRACEQLEASILQLSRSPKVNEKHSIVISSACPLITPTIQKLKKYFKKQFNSNLIIKNHSLIVTI